MVNIQVLVVVCSLWAFVTATQVEGGKGSRHKHWEKNVLGDKVAQYVFGKDGEFESAKSYADKTNRVMKAKSCEERDPVTKLCSKREGESKKNDRSLRALQSSNDEPYIELLLQTVNGVSAFSPAEAQIFQQAADFWNGVIAANGLKPTLLISAPADTTIRNDDCLEPFTDAGITFAPGTGRFETPNQVEKLYIVVALGDFNDGLGSTLAAASLCAVAPDDFGNTMPYLGTFVFDEVDFRAFASNDTLALLGTVKHEMGHIVGLGNLWEELGRDLVSGVSTPFYTGSNGRSGYELLGGSGALAVENDGGEGTALSHWEEDVFQNELMTGFLDTGDDAMSIMTVRALLDLGYIVNECKAEDFTSDDGLLSFNVNQATCNTFVNPNDSDPNDSVHLLPHYMIFITAIMVFMASN